MALGANVENIYYWKPMWGMSTRQSQAPAFLRSHLKTHQMLFIQSTTSKNP